MEKLVGNRKAVLVRIHGIDVPFIIDSGSEITSISQEFFDQHLSHLLDTPRKFERLKVIASNELEVPVTGYVITDMVYQGNVIKDRGILIVPTSRQVPGLLGTNIMKLIPEFAAIVSMEETRVLSSELTDDARTGKHTVHEDRVIGVVKSAGGETRIPAGTLRYIPAYVSSKTIVDNHSIVEPVKNLPPGTTIMPCIASKKFMIPVVNTSASDIFLRANTRLGLVKAAEQLPPEIDVVVRNDEIFVEAKSFRTEVNSSPSQLQEQLAELVAKFPGTDAEAEEYRRILQQNLDAFAKSDEDMGRTSAMKHQIKLVDDAPVSYPYRRIPPALLQEVKDHINDLAKKGFIEPSTSSYAAPIVVVRKKGTGAIRLCCDYRGLNAKTLKDAHPLPRIEESIDMLSGSKWFCSLDLRSAYNQVPMAEEDKYKTAFATPFGLMQWTVMSFGLCNAPATFQRLMNTVFREELFQTILCYLDDIMVAGSTIKETLERLETVLKKLCEYGLKVELRKCSFFQEEVIFLGHKVSANGIATDPEKVRVVKEWAVPVILKELRQYLGFTSYFRRYIDHFSQQAKPLHQLVAVKAKGTTKRQKVKIVEDWTEEHQQAFEDLRDALCQAPVLGYPRYDLPFTLETDASELGLGAVLSQVQDGKRRIIAYASRSLRRGESSKSNYSSKKLELLALKWAVTDKFSDYLLGGQFEVLTDNNPLTYLLKSKRLTALEQRWANALASYNFTIRYKPGKSNQAADILSRLRRDTSDAMSSAEVDTCFEAATCTATFPAELVKKIHTVHHDAQEGEDRRRSTDDERATELPTIHTQDMAVLQADDTAIARILHYRNIGRRPNNRERGKEDALAKKYLKHWGQYIDNEGVLYREITDHHGNKINQLVLPGCLKSEVMKALHDESGHQMTERTELLVRGRCFWPNIQQDVKTWIENCERCRISKMPHNKVKSKMGRLVATRPCEIVAMDYTLMDRASDGKENVLVLTDIFTKYSVAVPTKDQKAETVAKVLVKEWFQRVGIPLRLHSDRGLNFQSDVIKALCKTYGIKRSSTTPYHPEGNGQVERFNKTLHDLIRPLAADKKSKWTHYLPALVHAYNTTENQSTRESPFYLMFGRQCRLPVDILLGTNVDAVTPDDESWVSIHQQRLKWAYEKAFDQITRHADTRKERHDQKVKEKPLNAGQLVYLRSHPKGRKKVADAWGSRLYKVVAKQGNNDNYILERADGFGERKTVQRAELRESVHPTIEFLDHRAVHRREMGTRPTRRTERSRSSRTDSTDFRRSYKSSGRSSRMTPARRQSSSSSQIEDSSSSEDCQEMRQEHRPSPASSTETHTESEIEDVSGTDTDGSDTRPASPRLPRRVNRGYHPNPHNEPRSATIHLKK